MRWIMRLLFSVLVLCQPPVWAAPPQGVNLADLAGWDILVGRDALPSELYAAEELQRFLEAAAGQRLPVVRTADTVERHIYVGSSEAMQRSAVGFSVEGFGPEDLRIVIRDGAIAIAGGRPRGTLYGVYTFLENLLGVRFLTSEHTHVPRIGAWHVVGPIDRFYHPPLEMRWAYYGEVNRDPVFAARLRVNTVGNEERLGGKSRQRLISHSFAHQIPSSRYGQEHPDYFALRDGQRLAVVQNDAYDTEPCLTHPDVLRIVTDAVLAEIAADPDTANVSVSQNDNAKNCLCPNCAAIDEQEGTPMGTLLAFVNAVADTVAEKYPHVQVGTLSYWYSRKPPRTIQPRPNVQIQLCSIECCLLHAIDDPSCPKNVEFCEDMRNWGRISDRIYIWNYNTNFSNYLLPLPNLRVIGPNIRYFVAHHARGAFMQAAGNAWGAEMSQLRAYLISQLLWDPTRDAQQVMDEFLELHYGRAGAPIRRYLNRIHDRALASGKHHNCFGRLADYGLNGADVEVGLRDFAEALELAENELVRDRVERASICIYRAALEPIWYLSEGPLDPETADELRPLARRFLALCEKFQVDRAQESGEDMQATNDRVRALLGLQDPPGSSP